MTVRDVMMFKVKLGRAPEVAALFRDGRALEDKLGIPHARLFNAVAAGEAWLTRTVVVEYEDMKAWAAAHEKQVTSDEWRAFLPRIFGEDAPWTPVSRSLIGEIVVD